MFLQFIESIRWKSSKLKCFFKLFWQGLQVQFKTALWIKLCVVNERKTESLHQRNDGTLNLMELSLLRFCLTVKVKVGLKGLIYLLTKQITMHQVCQICR